MKKKILILISVIFFAVISVLGKSFLFNKKSVNKDNIDTYININKLDEEFMDKYYSDMEKLHEKSDLTNALIIVSLEEPKEVYGATSVVAAPNNTYFLDYESEVDKYNAQVKFEKDENIFSVSENKKYEYLDNDTSSYNSWGIEKSGLDHAIEYVNQNGGADVTVAIIDSGCNMDLFNQSYQGKIEEVYNLYRTGIYGHDVMFDNMGHGTHIAGTIAEGTPDNVKILPIKVGDEGSYLDSVGIIEGINYITDGHKADVINMSFGSYIDVVSKDAEYLAIEAAKKENIISVAAAGNSGDRGNPLEAPSVYDNTISIAAVKSDLSIAYFSSYNEYVTFAAPGVDIKSINGVLSGTSMATPHAVSAVAFLKSIEKDLTFDGVVNALKQNVKDLGAPGKDDYYGYGFIDLSDFNLCTDDNLTSCTILDVEKEFNTTSIEFNEVVFTPYNYGSLTNILASTVKLIDENEKYKIVRLDSLEGVEITGYDPYASGTQTATFKYKEFETTFSITNPENYEMGWKYTQAYDHEGNLTENYVLYGYLDHNMEIKKLYIPETIDNHNVEKIAYRNINYPFVFGNSNDTKNYTEIILPSGIKELGDIRADYFPSLYKITSLADELSIRGGVLSYSTGLTIIDANVLLDENSREAFYQATSLKEIRLSPNTKVIPYRAFYNCLSLKNIELPEGLKEIGDKAFYGTRIKNIDLPSTLEKVGELAFYNTSIEEIEISQSVNFIGEGAFSSSKLNKITVSNNNPKYDSRNNCNAVIETATNKLVAGSNSTVIPNGITEIGNKAFYNSGIESLVIPDGLEKIGELAFANSFYLYKLTIPNTVNDISDDSFRLYSPDYFDKDYFHQYTKFFYVYNSSYAYNYALSHRIAYVLLDNPLPPEITKLLYNGKTVYNAYDTLDLSSYIAYVYYEGSDEPEIVREFRNPIYEHGDSIRYNDTEALAYYDTTRGYYNMEISIPIDAVEKIPAEYEIPTDLYANVNNTLADVDLPEGFEWEDSSIVIDSLGNHVYNARFTPEDTDNFSVVEHIPIPVHVIEKTIIKPIINIGDKTYDGTTSIKNDCIEITNMDSNDYVIESVSLTNENAGSHTVLIELSLTNAKFENYVFTNGQKTKTFEVTINILKKVVNSPKLVQNEYVYNGEYQQVALTNIDKTLMTVEGDSAKDYGIYYVSIALKDKDNYVWDFGSSTDIALRFYILKADIEYIASDVEVVYDGNDHGINVEVSNENAVIKYMDNNGEYTLDEMPKYTDVGEYSIKYQIEIDINYNTVTGENTLRIIERTATNKIITFNSNSGTDETKIQEVPVNEEVNLNRNTFLKEGYRFKNWNTNRDGSGTTYDDEGTITITDDIILYAQWEKIEAEYIINDYDVNDVDNYIKGINAYTTVTDFKNTITLSSGYRVEVDSKNVDGNEVLYTGGKTKIYNGDTLVKEYDNIIMCDTNSDGKVNILDIYNVYLLFKNKNTSLTNIQKAAADYDNNGEVNIMDLYRTYLKMKGKV